MSSRPHHSVFRIVFAALCLLAIVSSTPTQAQVELEVTVGGTAGIRGQTDVKLPIYLKNPLDAVAGFELLIQMDRPDVAFFQLDVDTVGTLMSGWEFIGTHWLDANGYMLKVACLCAAAPSEPCSFASQSSEETPLINLLVTLEEEPPLFGDPFCQVYVNPFPGEFGFSDPFGQLIALSYEVVYDTNYFDCAAWAGDVCLVWEQTPFPPGDSISVDTSTVPYYDFGNNVILNDGSFIFGSEVCGDIDGSFDGVVDVADLTKMIDHLFISFGPIVLPEYGNIDQSPDGIIDVNDLTQLISHLFIEFDPISCP